jgi:hypothetical protein
MPPIGTSYDKFVAVTNADYTVKQGDDIITFTIASGQTGTLPLAKDCVGTVQNQKIMVNAAGSGNNLTIAVQAGNTLIGQDTLLAGGTALVTAVRPTVWTSTGGSGATGVSGFSGYSAYSGYSGTSGFSGYSGISGASGFSGYSGISGKSGYSGITGFSGYSGISGYSGYSGASGKSGYTGY